MDSDQLSDRRSAGTSLARDAAPLSAAALSEGAPVRPAELTAAPPVEPSPVDPGDTWNPPPEPSRLAKTARMLRWLPAFAWQRVARWRTATQPAHVMVAVADHYEPAYVPRLLNLPTSEAEQEERVERWCRQYRATADDWRDGRGRSLNHTYFLPAEDTYPAVVERLAEFSRAGYGELEVQLHHGVWAPDTAAATRATIESFRDLLVANGCLSRWQGTGPARYGFVHGNWALANSNEGNYCGVDNELEILAETGCYADFTLPSSPSPAQVTKINSIYECSLPFGERAPHRRGRDLAVGRPPSRWPLIVQGPLGVYRAPEPDGSGMRVRVENGEISSSYPPTRARIDNWRRAAVSVQGRPAWVFVKVHCHGLAEADFDGLIGAERRVLLRNLTEYAAARGDTLHFVSARELVNIALAACDGRDGDPSDYRDYRLELITPRR
jgi:hypothetical protein